VLAVNCGSSTLKYRVLTVTETVAPGVPFAEVHGGTIDRVDDHERAAHEVISDLARENVAVEAVGHRVVHGGARFRAPVVLDDAAMDALVALGGLAPLHNRAALGAVRASRAALAVPQVAVFDTAFHQHLPDHAARYAVPRHWEQHYEVRRYGFHGLAHRWMTERNAARAGTDAAATRLVTLQLGNGCSAAAVAGGQSIDTTMGLTPLEGLMMGTRAGDIDPAAVPLVAEQEVIGAPEVVEQLNREAGLLGVSGLSADVRDLLDAEGSGDERAALALTMFAYRVRKVVGAYLAALGGADAVVFGGGIGEHQPSIRARALSGLDALGIVLDARANEDAVGVEATISAPASAVRVDVIPVDEETIIAADTAAMLRGRPSSASM
jgi:acetate kinase